MRNLFKSVPVFFMLAGALVFLFSSFSEAQDKTEKRPVYVLTIEGAISPAFAGYLNQGLAKAMADNAQLVVVELNTPGGLLSTTREMATAIVESKTPVAVWVTPSGAHAASAGTFILYAAHIAAMDEGTNVGAATPIEMKGQLKGQLDESIKEKDARDKPTFQEKQDEESLMKMLEEMADPNVKAMRQKALEDTAAFIRGLAELRGRNAEWAVEAVRQASSITASEALEKNVIDLIAFNRSELLEKVDGRTIAIRNGEPVTLDTAHAPVVEFVPDWKTRILALITDPNVALILMSIGVYGLILEFYHPGSLIPGTIGAICLILGLYAMNVLPVNAAGAALVLLGLVFMVAESFIPSFGIMGIAGVIAFVTGAAFMFDMTGMPGMAVDWSILGGIGVFGLLVVGLTVLVTLRAYHHKASTGTEGMIGETAHIVEWKKNAGRVRIQGEVWSAFSDQDYDFKKDDAVLVGAVRELSLKIRNIE